MPTTIDVYFDYISPYAYFGWRNVTALAERRGWTIVEHPVVFAALLGHHGQLGPAEIPQKRAWTFRQVARYAARQNIPLEGPARHPFRSIDALRVSYAVDDSKTRHAIITTLFEAIWADGIDGGDTEALAAALTARGYDGAHLMRRTREAVIKDALKSETTKAIEAGVFGVPTYRVDGELFWGNDSLADLEMVVDGRDPVDAALVKRILSRPAGATRSGR